MGRLFEQRERAAEGIFVHDEEMRFIAHRRGFEALAAWASESMEFDPPTAAAYADRLVDAYVGGMREDEIVAAVQTDLERAGKPTLSSQVGLVLSQAIAEAVASAHPKAGGFVDKAAKDPADHLSHHTRKPTVNWSL